LAHPSLIVVPDPTPPVSRFPIPVIIDTDPGIDDTLALLLALASPEVDVRGISVTYGNTVIENAYRNCVEILRRAGRRLPIAVSARRPLKRSLAVAAETHGESGLGGAPVPPAGVILELGDNNAARKIFATEFQHAPPSRDIDRAVTGRDATPDSGFAHHFIKPLAVEELLEVLAQERK